MEHIAFAVKKDPLEVRQVNFIRKGDPFIGVPGAKLDTENFIPSMLKELMESSEYIQRKQSVESFNKVVHIIRTVPCENVCPNVRCVHFCSPEQ